MKKPSRKDLNDGICLTTIYFYTMFFVFIVFVIFVCSKEVNNPQNQTNNKTDTDSKITLNSTKFPNSKSSFSSKKIISLIQNNNYKITSIKNQQEKIIIVLEPVKKEPDTKLARDP